jgi:tetratricopeptide (TPR) repeat protein
MYDIKPLEREWKKYRKKKLKPWLIASVSFIVAGVLAIVLLDNTKIDFSTFDTSFMQADNTSSDEEKKVYHNTVKSNVLLNTALNKLETEKKVMDQVNNAANDSTNTFIDIPILDGKHENSVGSRQKGRAKVHLDIMETSSVTAYKDVEKRFSQSHDIDDALFLARSYYKKGNYKKAEHWALETNKVDPNMEESILIFVKSKIKLGRKNEAISILKSYLKRSNSQEAINLLHHIENNKI